MRLKRFLNSKKLLIAAIIACNIMNNGTLVYADNNQNNNQTETQNNNTEYDEFQIATEKERDSLKTKLTTYYNYLKVKYTITEEKMEKMDKILKDGLSFLSKQKILSSEIHTYEKNFEASLEKVASQNIQDSYIMLSNEVPVLSAKYGKETFVVLSLINMGESDVKDVVVTPVVDTSRNKWPFVIQQAYDAIVIPVIPSANNSEDAYNRRMDIGWNFKVREDALTGCYPLTFHAEFTCSNGEKGKTDIVTYINIKGKNPNNTLEDELEDNSNISKPRVIVTGFTTNPEVVYAGTVFTLNIKVQNTSADTAIENVLFTLKAAVENGSGSNAESYAAFLPTSGSSSVFAQKIGPGQIYDINIEMEAKADLSQKPYVLSVNSDYYYGDGETGKGIDEVSIPVKQEAKMDTSSAEIMPNYITVGEQSNIMFSVYNTGKTTLYNVKVNYEADWVDSGITYLGNIAPGNTGSVDSMLTGIAQDDGSGKVLAVITYEDESGNETRYEKEIELTVEEMVMNDFPFEDENIGEIGEVETDSHFPVWAIILIVVVVVIVIIVVIIIIVKIRKAKKHKEEMDFLDEDEL